MCAHTHTSPVNVKGLLQCDALSVLLWLCSHIKQHYFLSDFNAIEISVANLLYNIKEEKMAQSSGRSVDQWQTVRAEQTSRALLSSA